MTTLKFVEVQEYQELALRTESPVTAELMARIMACRRSLLYTLNDFFIVSKKLEDFKRYIYYGQLNKLPEDELDDSFDDIKIPVTPEYIEWARFLHAILGLYGEGHEHVAALDKEVMVRTTFKDYLPNLDRVNIPEEFGDNLWYIALGLDAMDISMLTTMRANIAKLLARYPQKFTAEAAADRNLSAENSAMQKELTDGRERTPEKGGTAGASP